MINSNIVASSVNKVNAKVELYNGSTLVTTCTCNDRLQDFTVERAGQENKFFGFGITHKLTVNLIDFDRELNITDGNTFKVYLGYDEFVNPYPTFYVKNVTRDETNNTITIVAYDKLYSSEDATINDLALEIPYTIKDVTIACASQLGITEVVAGKNLWNNGKFGTNTTDDYLTKTDTGFIFNRNGSTRGFAVYYSIPVKAGETYTFSCDQVGGARLYIYSDAPYGNELIFTSQNFVTYTFEEDLTPVFAVIIDTTVHSLEVSNIQIEKSAARTAYEPYIQAFNTFYEEGANFEGTESCKETLNAIAEATQTIYYLDNADKLIFKRLDKSGNPVLTVGKETYYYFESQDSCRLATITNTTELGDSTSVTDGEGYTQFVRNNPFWELRDDIIFLLENAKTAIGGIAASPFYCEWDGNFLLEPGDKIALTTEDNNTIVSYILNDAIVFDGTLTESTQWTYEEKDETAENPVGLGEALKQTYARVDKANKEIEILASDVSDNSSEIAALKITTESITATVEELSKTVSGDNETLTQRVGALEVTAENISASVTELQTKTGTLETDLNGLSTNLSGLSTDLSELATKTDTDIKGLDTKIAETIADLGELEGTVSTNTSSIGELQVSTEAISARVGTVETTTQTLTAKDSELEGKITTNTNDISSLTLTTEALTASVGTLTTKTEELTAKDTELDGSITEISGKVTTNTEDIATLKLTTEEFSTKIGTIETKTEELTAKDTELEGSITEVNSTVTTHTEEIGSLKLTTEELTASVGTLTTKTEELTTKDTELDGKITEVTTSVTTNTTDIAALKVSTEEISASIESLESTTTETNTNLGDLTTRVTTNEESIAALVIKDGEIEASVASLESSTSELTDSLADVSTKVETNTTNIATLTTTTESITASVESLETTTTELGDSLGNLETSVTENTTAIGELQVSTEEISASITELETTTDNLSGEVTTNKENIAALQITTEGITTTVSSLETNIDSRFEDVDTTYEELRKEVETKVTAEDITIAIEEERKNGATHVTTTTGFTFDSEGLTITKSDSAISTNIDEDGLSVYKYDEEVLTADNTGVKAQNLHATTYLIIGNNTYFADFTDADGTARAGCFWTGK